MSESNWPVLACMVKISEYGEMETCLLALRDKDIRQLLHELEDVRMRVEGEAMRRSQWMMNNDTNVAR